MYSVHDQNTIDQRHKEYKWRGGGREHIEMYDVKIKDRKVTVQIYYAAILTSRGLCCLYFNFKRSILSVF